MRNSWGNLGGTLVKISGGTLGGNSGKELWRNSRGALGNSGGGGRSYGGHSRGVTPGATLENSGNYVKENMTNIRSVLLGEGTLGATLESSGN